MYSGSTLKQLRTLDKWLGAHQKLDRLARRQLAVYSDGSGKVVFPATKQILQFEGQNGPDAIKRKTPAQGEPWHYYNPDDESDKQLLKIIADHHTLLVKALCEGNQTRASFEAAWLAHAVVDGLTPAHHYPYEQELTRLRGGEGIESRTTTKEKLVMHGDTMREKLSHNWQMWGDKGLLATHIAFEAGVAVAILPLRFQRLALPSELPQVLGRRPYLAFFKSQARAIADLHMYEEFYRAGWTPRLARKARRVLVPAIVQSVAYTWYTAQQEAERRLARAATSKNAAA
jgi:hypothetical protein